MLMKDNQFYGLLCPELNYLYLYACVVVSSLPFTITWIKGSIRFSWFLFNRIDSFSLFHFVSLDRLYVSTPLQRQLMPFVCLSERCFSLLSAVIAYEWTVVFDGIFSRSGNCFFVVSLFSHSIFPGRGNWKCGHRCSRKRSVVMK